MAKYIKGQKPENLWARDLRSRIEDEIASAKPPGVSLRVTEGRMLPYTNGITAYGPDREVERAEPHTYSTDLMIEAVREDGRWQPWIVIECKLGAFDTHNVLAYAAKAAAHRAVHPYLRYGVLVGRMKAGLTAMLARHGEEFNFIVTWEDAKPSDAEWTSFVKLLRAELKVLPMWTRFVEQGKTKTHGVTIKSLHRPLHLW